MQLEGIVSETDIKYKWSRQDESWMYYLEKYYSFLHGVHQDRMSMLEEKLALKGH